MRKPLPILQQTIANPKPYLDLPSRKDLLNQLQKDLEARKADLERARNNPNIKRNFDPTQWTVDGRSSDTQIGGVTVHEYGHAWHDSHAAEVKKYFKDKGLRLQAGTNKMGEFRVPVKGNSKLMAYRVTEYSETNFNELMAENFSLYCHGMVKYMDPDMVKFFDQEILGMDWGHILRPDIYKG